MNYMCSWDETATRSSQSVRYFAYPVPTPTSSKYSKRTSDYRDKFDQLISNWRLETAIFSTTEEKIKNKNFKSIVAMGETAVPLIISELKQHRDFLFLALSMIRPNERLFQNASLRRAPSQMIDAWLRWAERKRIDVY